jgi:hypothetical protein
LWSFVASVGRVYVRSGGDGVVLATAPGLEGSDESARVCPCAGKDRTAKAEVASNKSIIRRTSKATFLTNRCGILHLKKLPFFMR